MTSTRSDEPDPDLPGGRRRAAPRPTHTTSLGTRRRRIPRTTSRRWARRAATLWPFADAESLPGTAHLPGWLGQTILTLVTCHTRPGDRVLLLAPPIAGADKIDRRRSARPFDVYSALTEAVWTITRLGRSTNTATAGPTPTTDALDVPDAVNDPRRPSGGPRRESESGPGLAPPGLSPAVHRPVASANPQATETGPTGTFDLIITAVHPRSTDWFTRTGWNRLLTTNGVVAVVTHGDHVDGRLADPLATLVRTFSDTRCGWLDHIVVLDRPWPDRIQPGIRHAARSTTGPRPVRLIHHDLLLFGPLPADTDKTEPADPPRETSDA